MATIGVLALQGAFVEHINMLESLGANCVEIRKKLDFTNQLDGLILPGGESTVMGKLLHELGLFVPLHKAIAGGLPTLGTCAGLILLAKKILGDNRAHFGTMDITVLRNAYGRQLGSFQSFGSFAETPNVPMTFIRAPSIVSVSGNVEILAEIDSHIVAARQNNMIVTAFHPELTTNTSVHRYFLQLL